MGRIPSFKVFKNPSKWLFRLIKVDKLYYFHFCSLKLRTSSVRAVMLRKKGGGSGSTAGQRLADPDPLRITFPFQIQVIGCDTVEFGYMPGVTEKLRY